MLWVWTSFQIRTLAGKILHFDIIVYAVSFPERYVLNGLNLTGTLMSGTMLTRIFFVVGFEQVVCMNMPMFLACVFGN